jgi:hypothetical protein
VIAFVHGRAKTEQAKDAGRPRTRGTGPTEDAGMRRFAAGQAHNVDRGQDHDKRVAVLTAVILSWWIEGLSPPASPAEVGGVLVYRLSGQAPGACGG